MTEKIKYYLSKIGKILKENQRYVLAVLVICVAFFFSKIVPPVEMKEKNKQESYQTPWLRQEASLDRNVKSKRFESLFNSKQGDFYRLTFRAKSLEDEEILIKAVSDIGDEAVVGDFSLSEDDGYRSFEQVFETNGRYSDVVFSLKREEKDEDRDEEDWYDNRIFISDVFVTRLDVDFRRRASGLLPTVFGGVRHFEEYVPLKDDGNGPIRKKSLAEAIFISNGEILTSVALNVDKIGSGGEGRYQLELRPVDENTNETGKVIKKIKFSSNELAGYVSDEGYFHIDFMEKLEKGRKYYIALSGNGVEVDEGNRLGFADWKHVRNKPKSFLLSFVGVEKRNGARLLSNSKIEDLGSELKYTYVLNGNAVDEVDVFEQKGDVEFDGRFGTLVARAIHGYYFTYEIETVHPFQKARIEAQAIGTEKNLVRVEYSFDNSNWKEIDFIQKKGFSQIYDSAIDNGEETRRKFYLRIGYKESKKNVQDNDKFFGLKTLRITANLKHDN